MADLSAASRARPGAAAAGEAGFPKRVWFLWLQGMDDAPRTVRECHARWRAQSPGWDLMTLDARNVADWVGTADLRWMSKLPAPQMADAIRLSLLSVHGGVWADATVWCAQPLDQWLPGLLGSGCFAFNSPSRDKLMSTWFLASYPGNYLFLALRDAVAEHWRDHRYHNGKAARVLRKMVETALSLNPGLTLWWFRRALRDRARLSPYFAVHYKFTQLVRTDEVAADIWRRTPVLSADGPHSLQRYGLLKSLTPAAKAAIDGPVAPVFKLLWKNIPAEVPAGSTLGYLFRSGSSGP